MVKSNCEQCRFRARYDKNPKSLLGRLWRWHADWCPGWRGYLNSLDRQERERLEARYHFRRNS